MSEVGWNQMSGMDDATDGSSDGVRTFLFGNRARIKTVRAVRYTRLRACRTDKDWLCRGRDCYPKRNASGAFSS